MNISHIWLALALSYAVLLAPVLAFICLGWETRRREIIESFSADAMRAYFDAFHRNIKITGDVKTHFDAVYNSHFGRHRFLTPFLLFAAISGLLLCWSTLSLPDLLTNKAISPGKFPDIALSAVMGAYMWILYDEIAHWHSGSLSPANLYWWSFRLVIAVPMAYALSGIFTAVVALPIAFLLGALPTNQLMKIARRISAQKLGFADSEGAEISELQKLQGIDIRSAEQFAEEGITTVLGLAYCDPIKLTIRTGWTYSYVVDCTCQALLWLYVEEKIESLRKCGLRSAYEVVDLCLDLEDPARKSDAETLLKEAAASVGSPEASIRNIIDQVGWDPNSRFLYLSWSGTNPSILNAQQREVLGVSASTTATTTVSP